MVVGIERADKGVNGFSQEEIKEMKAYLQGCVYAWCNLKGEEWFSARDFLGGDNFFWEGTPMCKLYDHYKERGGETYAFDEAAKAAGRLLKMVLIDDKRKFKTREGFSRSYCWVKE